MGQRAEYLGIFAFRNERKKNERGRTVKGVVGESRECSVKEATRRVISRRRSTVSDAVEHSGRRGPKKQ